MIQKTLQATEKESECLKAFGIETITKVDEFKSNAFRKEEQFFNVFFFFLVKLMMNFLRKLNAFGHYFSIVLMVTSVFGKAFIMHYKTPFFHFFLFSILKA